jgi:Transposase DDE domain group 1
LPRRLSPPHGCAAANAASTRGAASLVAEAINTARAAGITGLIVVRADCASYTSAFVATCQRNHAHFLVTARMTPKIHRAITTIDESAWTAIKYPNAIFDEDTGAWIADAEIAEVPYTAFADSPHRTDGRLIVCRVRDLNPAAAAGQDELFATHRYHVIFTDSPFELTQAETQHRGHAIVEQVFADLLDEPLAHLPSGQFNANAAWLQLAATAHTLTRALGVLGSPRHALARGSTIRKELITVAARPARAGRDAIIWHLPCDWPWEHAWHNTFHATHRGPPALAA